jgi:hypothetical protein
MQGLLRLAGWGVAAMAALLLVVFAANSGGRQQRLSAAFAGFNGTQAAEAAKAETAQAAQLARLAANERDTRRLMEMVRSLAGDRERLLARVTILERNLESVTGSIQRQAVATPPAATTQPAPASAMEPPLKTAPAQPQTNSPAEPAVAPPPLASRVAGVAPSGGIPELEAIPARPAAGVDIGGATNFDGLRTLWNAITSSHDDLFEGLHPIVTVRENSKSRAAELRLIAGPLSDAEPASRICATLAAAKRYCRLVAFEGQPLALNAPRAPSPAGRRHSQGPPDLAPRSLTRIARRRAGRHSRRRNAGDLLSDGTADQLAADRGLPGDRRGALSALSRHRIRAGVACVPGRVAKLALRDIPDRDRSL